MEANGAAADDGVQTSAGAQGGQGDGTSGAVEDAAAPAQDQPAEAAKELEDAADAGDAEKPAENGVLEPGAPSTEQAAPVEEATHDRQKKRDGEKQDRKEAREKDRRSEKDRHGEKDKKERHRERDKDKDREKEKEKEKDRDRDVKESKHDRKDDRKERSKRKDDDRGRDSSRKRRERSASRDKDKDKDKRSRSDKDKKRSSRHRSRSRERRHKRSRSRERKSRHQSGSRERHRSRRRRDGSESGSEDDEFGGYVPRKRQEEPRAAGYSTSYVDPYAALRSNRTASSDPQEIARQMQEQQLKARQLVLQQQAASAVAAASKTQREVYVGNLVAGLVTEDALRQLFNSTMAAAFPAHVVPGMDAVVSVSLHSEGRYAFVELRSPEMATAALQLSNQVQLLGQSISVGRPSGYVDPSRAQEAAAAAAAALQAFQAGDMAAMEFQLQQANLGVPGLPVATANLANPVAAAPAAVAAAAPGALPLPPPIAPAAAQPVPAQPRVMAASVEPALATRYLEVTGMVTPEVLQDDTEYGEVILDLQEECGKYGAVTRVIVPRPPVPSSAPELFGSNNYGKAFVEFADENSCAAGKAAIHGRLFAGETVRATFVTPEYFSQLG